MQLLHSKVSVTYACLWDIPASLAGQLGQRDRVRLEAGRREAVDRLIDLYRELLATPPELHGEAHTRACLRAASSYVSWLQAHLSAAEDGRWVAESQLAATAAGRTATAQTLAILERSPFSRLRRKLLGVRPLVAAYRRLKKRRGGTEEPEAPSATAESPQPEF